MLNRRLALSVFASVLGIAAMHPAPAHAQACTVTAAAASYVIPAASHYDTSPTVNLTGVGTGDYLFEDGWWFRVSGDAQEFSFPAPDTTTCAAAAGTITWTNVSTRGFSASLALSITSPGANMGEVIQTLTVTNLSAVTPLTLDLFHFSDFDVNGTAAGDSGVLANANNYITITDATSGAAQYRAFNPPANAFLARPFNAATDVAGVLSDALVTNFDNTTMPFGPADITAGFQWSLVIPPSGSASVSVSMTGNTTATPVELMGFSVD